MEKHLTAENETIRTTCDRSAATSAAPVSRRVWLGAAVIVAGGGITCVMPEVAVAKVSQKSASYQNEPKGKVNLCATCKYFIAPKACLLVEGDVSPAGWCQLFEKKSGS